MSDCAVLFLPFLELCDGREDSGSRSAHLFLPFLVLKDVTHDYKIVQYYQETEQRPMRNDGFLALCGHASDFEDSCAFFVVYILARCYSGSMREVTRGR